MRRPKRESHEMRESWRPISKRLHAALLRSFSGQHSEKMVCGRGVPGVPRFPWQANSHFDPI